LNDRLERALGLGLEVLGRRLVEVDSQQLWQRVGVGERLRVVGRVAADLAERPRGGSLDMVFWLDDDRVDERRYAL